MPGEQDDRTGTKKNELEEKQMKIMFLVWLALQAILFFRFPSLFFSISYTLSSLLHIAAICAIISILFSRSLRKFFNFSYFVLNYILRILKLVCTLIYILLTRSLLTRSFRVCSRFLSFCWCWYCCCCGCFLRFECVFVCVLDSVLYAICVLC